MITKVKIRQKKISRGRLSLFLDYYPPILNRTGKAIRKEYLRLYIFEKPKTAIDKQHNKETLKKAEFIRQKRENNINKPEIYTEYEREQLRKKERGEQSFIDYLKELAKKRIGNSRNNWEAVIGYMIEFSGGSVRFADLNEKYLDDFKAYLLTVQSKRSNKSTIKQNTAASYFGKIKTALKQAYRDEFLSTDLNAKTTSIKEVETRREYLTLEELDKLVKTPCDNDALRRASLFSVLTGLRFSDIQKMVWGEVRYIEGQGYFLYFNQKKTSGKEYLPISEQAVTLLGERGEPKEQVFKGLKYSVYNNKSLKQWVQDAGINKKISFHCFRHTFATLQIFNGTDIYTVSKMLGHRNLKTTQVYAKIVDEAQREASERIKLNL